LRAGPTSDNDPGALLFKRLRNCRGVTLLELIVVLIIVGLMSAVVVPRLAGPMGNLDLKTASQKTLASLRYVRSHAAAEKKTYVAVFDFDNRRLTVAPWTPQPAQGDFRMKGSDAGGRTDTAAPDGEAQATGASKTYQLPDGVKFARGVSKEGDFHEGQFRIFFYPSGGSSGGEITVANERDAQYRVHIDFITGAAELSEVAGS